MDSNEYKIRMSQIHKMLEEKNALGAAKLADGLDWRRSSNVKDLNLIAEVYRGVKNYDQELEVLLLAYNKASSGRAILENLVKCAIELKNPELAVQYYEEYIKVFPNNTYKYYLKFMLKKAQGATYRDQIVALEEYLYFEHNEKGMFELAYLYHQEGMVKKCVEMCDDIIMWFHPCEESYRAMELKMRYVPLNEFQIEKYRQKHKNKTVKNDIQKAPDNNGLVDDIVIQDFSTDGYDTDAFAFDLSKGVQSVLEKQGYDNDDNDNDDNAQIPGQLSLEEMMCDIKSKAQTAVHSFKEQMELPYRYPINDNPYLDSEELLRAKTKELSIGEIVSDKELHNEAEKPKVDLTSTQSFNIMQGIENDLASILGDSDDTFAEAPYKNDYTINKEPIVEPVADFNTYNEENKAAQPLADETLDINDTFDEQAKQDLTSEINSLFINDDTIAEQNKAEGSVDDNSDSFEEQSLQGDYTLTKKHIKTLGYFATIAGFDRALAKAINLIKDGNRCMAISSLSEDNRVALAQKLLEVAYSDLNHSSLRIAVIKGEALNLKNIDEVFDKILNGFIIIDKVSELTVPTVDNICHNLKARVNVGIVICDNESELKGFLEMNPALEKLIDVRIHLPVLTNKELASFGEEYAASQGYIIDEIAKLAIYDIIGQLQKGEIVVTVSDIKTLIDKAIAKKESKSFSFFTKSKSGVHVLQEKDFT